VLKEKDLRVSGGLLKDEIITVFMMGKAPIHWQWCCKAI